jgi:tRNA-2-methylthio-N6-dimethylallyladenosine synthase
MFKKYYIKTFGCQMNEYDSQKMSQLLEDECNLTRSDDCNEADVIILNTCSIREKAQEKVFHQIGRWKKLKDINKNLIIAIGGCVGSQEGEKIIKRMPCVDIVFGPQTIHRLGKFINIVKNEKRSVVDVSFPELEKFDHFADYKVTGNEIKSYVSIMEGCSKFCSYCIVPYTRGQEFSRDFDDIIYECTTLVNQGIKEITLLGQNVNHYLGKMHDNSIIDFPLLINYISSIDEIKRIRFMTSHPAEFSNSLIESYKDNKKLANHLHLPVQSGSDKILYAMKRGYTVLEYKNQIKQLKKIRPNISITSDFIIGFPGETEEDFLHTVDLIKEIYFDHSYSFIYSPRPGTPAANIKDIIPLEIKQKRLYIIQNILKNQAMHITRHMNNTIQDVLIEDININGNIKAKTENNRTVFISNKNSINNLSVGDIISTKITKTSGYSLYGTYEY